MRRRSTSAVAEGRSIECPYFCSLDDSILSPINRSAGRSGLVFASGRHAVRAQYALQRSAQLPLVSADDPAGRARTTANGNGNTFASGLSAWLDWISLAACAV